MPKTASAGSPNVTSLAERFDCLLLDLDGTVFRGHAPTEGAVDTLDAIECRSLFVTNNATRSADAVAGHLTELGFAATADDVVTSAQSAAAMLARMLPAGAAVLVVGTDALAAEVDAVGLRPVQTFDENPDAVIQGLSMTIGWPELAEAALAIRSGAVWVTTNLDATLPTERGLLPGNGSLVAALRTATGCEPSAAGKPAPALMRDALARGDFRSPLVVGDRLDTDIAGANAAELPSLMVLTGVNTARDAVEAVMEQRPTFIGADLRSLLAEAESLAIVEQPAWKAELSAGTLTVTATGQDPGADGLSIVRAVAHAVWNAECAVPGLRVRAGDESARRALQNWSLDSDDDPLA